MSNLVFENYSQKSYLENFDGKAFAKGLVGEFQYEFRTTCEDFLHNSFKDGKLRGKTLLDFGCGPTVRGAISASGHVQYVTLADLVEGNRKEIEKWLRKDPDAIDCSWEFKYIAGLENKSDVKELEDRVRKSVVEILPCDFMLPNPLHPKKAEFDIVTTCLCLDCVTSIDDYKNAMKNVATLIKRGGNFAIFGLFGSPNYTVANVQFPSCPLTEEVFKKAIAEAGMELMEYDVQEQNMTQSFTPLVEYTFCAIARKL